MSLSLVNDTLEQKGFGYREKLQDLLQRVSLKSPFYQAKFKKEGVDPSKVKSIEDLKYLPFTTKDELREAYPLGLGAVEEEKIVRIHSSSGTTGKAVIIPYTKDDVDTWAEMMKRCYLLAGVTPLDRVQITPGYGLWTAGIGFQAGAELLGAMALPMGPGNTEKQIQMLYDLKSTVLTSTSSYALLLAEEVAKRNLKDKISLRIGIIGSERWSEKTRRFIEDNLGVESFDIYGLTEIYGPGIALDCSYHQGLHYWADHLLFEIIDPATGENLPDGEMGELVITTLTKEGAPLLRYRTGDLTRLLPEPCPCGSLYPRIDRIFGRCDDRVKIKGVNIYPGQIDDILSGVEGAEGEYQVILKREEAKDSMLLKVEIKEGFDQKAVSEKIKRDFKTFIGVSVEVEGVSLKTLPRSEKKTKRIVDLRDL